MKIRIPLWMALAGCLGCLALGRVGAQAPQAKPPADQKGDPNEGGGFPIYPYLPEGYAQPFVPSMADWQALRLTALSANTTRITAEFSRQGLSCFLTPKGLVLTLDLAPQPTWKHYAGGGKFTAPVEKVKGDLQQAVDVSLRTVRAFFPEVKDEHVTIGVHLLSERVGVWEGGKLNLLAENPAPPK